MFYGIYRDDGSNVMYGKKSTEEMVEWLKQFQENVNELTDSNFLQFTLDIWDPDFPPGEILSNKNVKTWNSISLTTI